MEETTSQGTMETQTTSSAAPESSQSKTTQQTQPSADQSVAAKLAAKSEALAKTQAQATDKPVVPAFTPNFKVKAYNKEYEIPEMFRGLITNEETQKQVAEIFSKAYALDEAKPIHQSTVERANRAEAQYNALHADLQKAAQHVGRNDFENAFKVMGINPTSVYQWVLEKARMQQLPPEQQQQIMQQKQIETEAFELRQQNEYLQQQMQQQAIVARQQSLSQAISRPGVVEIASEYDQKVGQPGAFAQEVIRRAAWMESQTGQDITAEQAVDATLQFVNAWRTPAQTTQEIVAEQAPATKAQKAKVPVIPSVPGKGVSPVKRIPKSIDDLRQLAASMQE